MSNAKEIRTKIDSVRKTQKITRAMEMVAASKMRKAQNRMYCTRPYAEKIRQAIHHLGEAHPEYHHKFLEMREVKRVGYMIIGTDRGLCGSLNNALFKTALNELKQWHDKSVEVALCLVGAKAENFFRRINADVVAKTEHLGDEPKIKDLIGVIKVMIEEFIAGKIDKLYIIYNNFINTMSQKAVIEQLLPIAPEDMEVYKKHHWDYIYEPDARELIDILFKRYIESLVYQAVVENIACEQAARMVAMKNATENAGTLIDDLQLIYNKARQAAITKELAEIVAGAEAV